VAMRGAIEMIETQSLYDYLEVADPRNVASHRCARCNTETNFTDMAHT
jgi:hypothetical protein